MAITNAMPDLERDLTFYPAEAENLQTLTQKQIHHFNTKGFIFPLEVFPKAKAEANRAYFDDIIQKALDAGFTSYNVQRWHIYCQGIYDIITNGRIFCDHTVFFPYLSDVNDDDGGLLVVPGSHKSMFDRPAHLFNNGRVEDPDNLPDSVVNIKPKAGDFVIMNELVTHSALPWLAKDRSRMIIVLRYQPQYKGGSDLPETILNRLSPETRELVSRASYQDVKEIVNHDTITLTV